VHLLVLRKNDSALPTKEGKDDDELMRIAGGVKFSPHQTGLVVIGRWFAGGGLKKVAELWQTHGSPPSRRVDARCLVIDGLC
jgi:hypothetical protein